MSSLQHKHNKQSLLTSVAESIGSTLGTIASKASEMPEAISHSNLMRTAAREGKNFVRRSKTVARKIGNPSKKAKTRKVAKPARRKVHGAKTGAKRVARALSAKRKIVRRGGRKK